MPQDTLTIGAVSKTEADAIRVYCDFGNQPEVIDLLVDADGDYDPDAVAFSSVNVTTSGSGAPTVSAIQQDYNYQLSARVSGGSAGDYGVTFAVVLPGGVTISRTGNVQIVEA